MIRAVLDTNIIISAQFWSGAPGKVYAATASQKFTIVTSEALIAEVRRVLNYPKFARALAATGKTANDLVSDFQALTEVIDPVEILADAVRDPTDVHVLACAVAGKADYIVTGDDDLLTLRSYQEIPIVTASAFFEIISAQATE
jgi:uncharacterized protein